MIRDNAVVFFSPRARQLRRRRRVIAVLSVAALFTAAVLGLLKARERPASIANNPSVEFAPTTGKNPSRISAKAAERFNWPLYGYSKDRARYLPAPASLRPPFVRRWAHTGKFLLEFPPVLGGKTAFLLKNNGALYAISKKTGKGRWRRKLGALAASSPAYGHGVVYVVLLARGNDRHAGRVVAVTGNGRTRWSRKLPSRSESSPLLNSGKLIFGSEDGTVFALRSRDGKVLWRYRADGAVKSGIALSQGRLYFGDYGGTMHCIRLSNGSRIWQRNGAGNFYSTPAVAYGRVYIGSVDGRVYSFSANNGTAAWAKQTGAYVYASPAVATVPGGRPSVYIGSYNGTFYALDARTGRTRWSHNAGGKISGGATVVGELVYFSDLAHHRTYGLSARTGRLLFRYGHGAFNPVISDGRWIFLTGYSSLYALAPK